MLDEEEVTPKSDSSAVLRIEDLRPKLEPYLSERAKQIFKNVRTELSEELFYYGRVVHGEESVAMQKDFAERLNLLFDMFNGYKSYYCLDSAVQPRVVSCIATPMAVPLAPLGKRRCKVCGCEPQGEYLATCRGDGLTKKHDTRSDFVIENPIVRTMYLTYVFVEGLTMDNRKYDYEAKRVWLNEITSGFLLAMREGTIPENSVE